MGRRRIARLWSKVHDREGRGRGGSGWGKPLEECQREWREGLQDIVDRGEADTLEEAAVLRWEQIYAWWAERKGKSVEEVREEFEEERRRSRYYQRPPRS